MGRHRILAIDDNTDTLELIRMTLEDEFDVLTLSDPMDAFELVELFEPDLLVLDVMMPKLTGFQLVEMLHRSPAARELPVIILSAKNSTRDIKHGYKLGASLYLTKPFQPDRLMKNVKTQFEMNPPAPGPKGHVLHDVRMQLMKKPCFKEGRAVLAGSAGESVDLEKREQELKERFHDRQFRRSGRADET